MEHQGQQLHGHATNKVDEHSAGGFAGAGMGTHGGVGTGGQLQPMKDDHKTDGVLRRSGSSSSSSSSSEDDGVGGRRKKGMNDKIKEKLPGGNKQADEQHTAGVGQQAGHAGVTGTGTGTGVHGAETTGEKKGVMEKIKEKLPGQH